MQRKYFLYVMVLLLLISVVIGILLEIKSKKEKNEDAYEEESDAKEMIYNDVAKDNKMSKYINYLVERNIMQLDNDGNFYPDRIVTKGELNKIIVRALLNPAIYESISEDEYVKYADILKTYFKISEDNNIEKLKTAVTRKDIAIVLARADLSIRNKSQSMGVLSVSDIKETDEVSEALILHSIKEGYFDKVNDKFYPNSNISRADISKIIYTFLNN